MVEARIMKDYDFGNVIGESLNFGRVVADDV